MDRYRAVTFQNNLADIRVKIDNVLVIEKSEEKPKTSFRQLFNWEKHLLIRMLIADKYIPTDKKLSILRSNRKDLPHPYIPRGSGRGLNASYMVFDCSYGCKYSAVCKSGKRCPYDEN